LTHFVLVYETNRKEQFKTHLTKRRNGKIVVLNKPPVIDRGLIWKKQNKTKQIKRLENPNKNARALTLTLFLRFWKVYKIEL